MSAPKFGPNDKIFAKVRGYPPWPARVEGVADETPNKVKYHVYFYGTGETAVCKQEELFPYVDYREKFGKPMKKKGFNEALAQIDSELGLSPSAFPPQTPGNDTDGEINESLVSDDASAKKVKSASNTPLTSKNKAVRRKTESSDSEQSAKKPRKKSEQNAAEESSTPSESVPTSRSGRKIKPKKFSGASEDEEEVNMTPKTKAGSKNASLSAKSKQPDNQLQLDAELLKNGTLVAFTPKGEEVRLKLNLNKPDNVKKSKEAKIEWEETILARAREIRDKIESGKILPENVKKEIQEKYQDKLLEIEERMGRGDRKEKLEFLKIEGKLLDLDVRIKSSLSLKEADPDTALQHIDELLTMKITPLMLKKHPEVVDTIKKLRKYVGNTSSWSFSEQDTEEFAMKCSAIRSKAETVYNKLKSLFMVPYGKSFWEVFADELKEFHEKTKGMEEVHIFGLITDPTEKKDEEMEEPNESSTSAA